MTTTSQALQDTEAADYKAIQDRFARLSKEKQKELSDEQAQIVQDAIRSVDAETRATIMKKMANLIRSRILRKPKFNSGR
ncbi:MAG: hypothetical protein WD688_10090 [Candidatus Binatia bacterium]